MPLHAESKLSSQRLAFLRGALVAMVVLLLTGFWQLQVVRSDYYANLAERNRIRTLPVMAPRGLILDRDSRPLVDHYPSFSVILTREYVDQIKDSLPDIAHGLGEDLETLQQRIDDYADAPPYQAIVLKDDASLSDIAFVEAHRTDLPELELLLVYRRRYPPGDFGAHVFGYVGEATRREIKARGYNLGDIVGKMGLERYYNQVLMGENGQRRVIVDSRGKEVEKLDRIKPVPGRPLRLTLDRDLQTVAEQVMHDREGALVALDPRTGDVLATVSRPAFDPNLFATGMTPADWQRLTNDPAKPLLNRVIQAQLAPGSIFKVIIATAALEEGLIDPNSFRLYCPGYATHYGRVFRCWRPQGHGWVNLHKALVESCDVFFYELGERLGIERIARYAKMLGLGERTGIDMPGEEPGLVPSPEWKRRVQHQPWWNGETISVAIGQGPVLVTPLQLAYVIGGIASGGSFARPRLLLDSEPVIRHVPLKPETVKIITDALWGVVNEAGGTGGSARLPDVDMAGKTGTAQLASFETQKRSRGGGVNLTENAWFVGFAPRRNPEVVVCVLLEHGEHGASAAPLAREVIRAYYDKKRGKPINGPLQTAAAASQPASAAQEN